MLLDTRNQCLLAAMLYMVSLPTYLLPAYAQATGSSGQAETESLDVLQPYVMPPAGAFRPDRISIEQSAAIADWARSGHANASSESFVHWNEEGEIPPICATCHSGAGFRSLYGLDGSAPGLPEQAIPIGGVVDCETCHNPGLSELEHVRFPSGLMQPVEPGEASCMTCHQGRAAGVTVAEAVAGMVEDEVQVELGFINPHYALAAATWLGGRAAAGFQYPEKSYSGRFFHARPVNSCASCHDPHTLQVSEQTCASCHENSTPQDIRLSRISYDGSGDLSKGIRADIAANAEVLKTMIVDYAAAVAEMPIVYDGHRYPYFFADANSDNRADETDGKPVVYKSWTPRLLKAAYNWKLVTADPGAYTHNPHYVLELLHDTIEDLAASLDRDMSTLSIRR